MIVVLKEKFSNYKTRKTVKYLGNSSDNEKSKRFSLAAALVNQEKNEVIPSSGSAPSSPLQTKRENFSIKVPGINKKSLKELDKDELEEIAYVIRHHEKNNSRPYKNNYFFNNEGKSKVFFFFKI